ncbi:MAG: ATP-binding domain-containing protein [Gemmatales bacterium]|nr:ATP-binding domain-containing protein [Gemmatales bacterium]
MGYVVYEMPSVAEAPPQYRRRLMELIQQLDEVGPANSLGFLPYFEALGNCWFKRRYDPYRLVAKLETVPHDRGHVHCVVLVAFVPRDSGQYCNGDPARLEKYYGSLLEAHAPQIQKHVEQELRRKPPPPAPPDPDYHLLSLLRGLRPQERADAFFIPPHVRRSYELLRLETQRATFYKLLCGIWETTGEEREQLLQRAENSIKVIYVRLREPELNLQHVFLLGIVCFDWPSEQCQSAETEARRLYNRLRAHVLESKCTRSHDFFDALSQLAERAFPAYLLVDEGLFQEVWRQREVFLPLSTNEMSNLENILAGKTLPCVLEGRAGSGKSTLLIYYTAERLAGTEADHAASSNERPYRLLYISQSQSLINKASDLIERIRYRLVQQLGTSQNLQNILSDYKTYQEWALEQLPPARRERFLTVAAGQRGGYISFSRFTDLMRGYGPDGLRNAAGRRYSPEAIWFVLRSYIKGYKVHERGEDRWLSFEEYQDREVIPDKDRQVSSDLYRVVWEQVWPWYKRLTVPSKEDEIPSYWDDLDLAWEVLQHRRPDAPKYDILVCDEAQDFSRVEIASLLSSLSWMQYNLAAIPGLLGLSNEELPLPIIFAGDAHQTVNPSCFRWERVSSDIAHALTQHVASLPPARVPRLKLHYNYRNAPSIALLCNAIQLLRQHTLGHKSELQNIWQPDDIQANLRVRRVLLDGEPRAVRESVEYLLREGVLVIGPVPDDPQFQETTAFWRKLGFDQSPSDRVNYVTVAQIKGLEQEHVVVLGFGAFFQLLGLKDFWNWRNAVDNPEIDESKRFQAEFFLNNLYVAVSRARETLWLVETQEGWQKFWEELQRWLRQNPQTEARVGFDWSPADLREMTQAFIGRWLELAKEFERLAHDQKNAEHAERAAYYYDRAEKPLDKERMLAWRQYYQGEVLAAAHKMWSLDKALASDWFWEATLDSESAWDELAGREVEPTWRRELARAYSHWRKQATDDAARSLLRKLEDLVLQRKVHESERHKRTWKVWNDLVLSLCKKSGQMTPISSVSLELAYHLAVEIAPKEPYARNYKSWQNELARLSYRLERYGLAADHWEKAEETQHRDYFIAKAESSPYPLCLRWWEQAGDFQRILQEYDHKTQTGEQILPEEDQRRIESAEDRLWLQDFWQRLESGKLYLNAKDTKSFIEEFHTRYQKSRIVDRWIERWSAEFLLEILRRSFLPQSMTTPLPTGQSASKHIMEAVIHGFALASRSDRIIRYLEAQAAAGSDPHWLKILELLTQSALDFSKQFFADRHYKGLEAAANLALLCLELVWYSSRRPLGAPGNIPELEASLRRYLMNWVSDAGDLSGEDAQSLVLYCLRPSKEDDPIQMILSNTLRLVADGIEDWICAYENVAESPTWPRLARLVDAIGYALLEHLDRLGASGKIGQSIDSSAFLSRAILCGRFVEQAPFRKRAVEYYERLEQIMNHVDRDRDKWLSELSKRKASAEQRLQRFRARVRTIYLNPGDRREIGDLLEIRTVSTGRELILTFAPRDEAHQLRYLPPSNAQEPPELLIHPEIKHHNRWQESDTYVDLVSWHDRRVWLRWDMSKGVLYVEVERDARYVVSFIRDTQQS